MTQLGLDYPTKWGRGYRARFIRGLLHKYFLVPYTRFISSLEVRGLENIEGRGPFIFVANHTSNLDTPLVIASVPTFVRKRLVVAAAMDNFFMDRRQAFRTVLMFNAIPIDRHRVNRRSAQLALELVEDHWNLLIYPEGGRTPDGELQEFKGGAAYLGERAKATVIPTYIHDAGLLQGPKYAKAPKFVNTPSRFRHHVIVAFGPSLSSHDGENMRKFGARIEEAVKLLGRQTSGNDRYGLPLSDG
jgi:1-acyl-sn-glycerol-3-phosphate acyltransferase